MNFAVLCATIAVLGRPLPWGYVTLSPEKASRPGRSLVRFEQGRFCLEGLEPGRYKLAVAPLGHAEPMALADEKGARVETVKLAKGRADLSLSHAPAPADCRVKVEASVKWLGAPAAGGEPVLAAARVGSFKLEADAPDGWSFAWLEPGQDRLNMEVAAGTLASFELGSRAWALAQLDPPLGDDAGSQRRECDGPRHDLTIVAGKAAISRGLATAGGKPYAPDLAGPADKRRAVRVRSENFMGEFLGESYAGEDGRWEILGAEGFRVLTARGEGDGFAGAVSLAPASRLSVSRTLEAEAKVSEAAEITMATPGLTVDASASHEHHGAKDWRVVGLPAGAKVSPYAMFFIEEGALVLAADGRGVWHPIPGAGNPVDGERMRFPAGAYDLRAVEIQTPFEAPAVRRLALAKNVSLPAGAVTPVSLPVTETAGGAFETALPASSLSPAALAAAGSWPGLHEALTPRVDLYDGQGEWAATAFGLVPKEELMQVRMAADLGSVPARSALAKPKTRRARVTNLAPGRYRAEVVAGGKVVRSGTVEIKAGGTATLAAGGRASR